MVHVKATLVLVAVMAFGAVAVACAPGEAAVPAAGASRVPAISAAGGSAFPTGPAVLVEPGYAPPEDRVPSTGAYLPVNGKPTLVYVDAIW